MIRSRLTRSCGFVASMTLVLSLQTAPSRAGTPDPLTEASERIALHGVRVLFDESVKPACDHAYPDLHVALVKEMERHPTLHLDPAASSRVLEAAYREAVTAKVDTLAMEVVTTIAGDQGRDQVARDVRKYLLAQLAARRSDVVDRHMSARYLLAYATARSTLLERITQELQETSVSVSEIDSLVEAKDRLASLKALESRLADRVRDALRATPFQELQKEPEAISSRLSGACADVVRSQIEAISQDPGDAVLTAPEIARALGSRVQTAMCGMPRGKRVPGLGDIVLPAITVRLEKRALDLEEQRFASFIKTYRKAIIPATLKKLILDDPTSHSTPAAGLETLVRSDVEAFGVECTRSYAARAPQTERPAFALRLTSYGRRSAFRQRLESGLRDCLSEPYAQARAAAIATLRARMDVRVSPEEIDQLVGPPVDSQRSKALGRALASRMATAIGPYVVLEEFSTVNVSQAAEEHLQRCLALGALQLKALELAPAMAARSREAILDELVQRASRALADLPLEKRVRGLEEVLPCVMRQALRIAIAEEISRFAEFCAEYSTEMSDGQTIAEEILRNPGLHKSLTVSLQRICDSNRDAFTRLVARSYAPHESGARGAFEERLRRHFQIESVATPARAALSRCLTAAHAAGRRTAVEAQLSAVVPALVQMTWAPGEDQLTVRDKSDVVRIEAHAPDRIEDCLKLENVGAGAAEKSIRTDTLLDESESWIVKRVALLIQEGDGAIRMQDKEASRLVADGLTEMPDGTEETVTRFCGLFEQRLAASWATLECRTWTPPTKYPVFAACRVTIDRLIRAHWKGVAADRAAREKAAREATRTSGATHPLQPRSTPLASPASLVQAAHTSPAPGLLHQTQSPPRRPLSGTPGNTPRISADPAVSSSPALPHGGSGRAGARGGGGSGTGRGTGEGRGVGNGQGEGTGNGAHSGVGGGNAPGSDGGSAAEGFTLRIPTWVFVGLGVGLAGLVILIWVFKVQFSAWTMLLLAYLAGRLDASAMSRGQPNLTVEVSVLDPVAATEAYLSQFAGMVAREQPDLLVYHNLHIRFVSAVPPERLDGAKPPPPGTLRVLTDRWL